MSEETEKLQEAVKYQKNFEKKYPHLWKMVSYYSWNDNVPVFHSEKDKLTFELYYDKRESRITSCQITIKDEKAREAFAQDPIAFLQKQLFDTPVTVKDNKAIIDFAQETILKAIKGA